jgi:hypothetical protein
MKKFHLKIFIQLNYFLKERVVHKPPPPLRKQKKQRSAIKTRKSEISKRTSVMQHAQEWLISTNNVQIPPAECDFTSRVWFYTKSVISSLTSVILTLTSVILTLTIVITTRSSVIYTRRV